MPYPKDNLRSVTTQQSSYKHYLYTNTYQPIKSIKFLEEPFEAQPTTPSTVWLSQRHSNNEQIINLTKHLFKTWSTLFLYSGDDRCKSKVITIWLN